MPFYTDDQVGPVNFGLQDFKPTYGQSLSNTMGDTFAGNPTAIGINLLDVHSRNDEAGERLSNYDAEAVIKQAGVRGLKVADGQYNRQALDIIIERKRQEQMRADISARTEYSWAGTPVRALATVAGSILDPVNIAAAFVPVVGEARVGAMLGNTAAGSLERAGARALIGVAEGGVGAALVEPLIYAGRTQLQDDYHMSDSLTNIAFGAALGGGLHVTAGILADKFRASDPYARFQGLDQNQVRTVLDFERGLTGDITPAQIKAATDQWTPEMRSAAGFGAKVEAAADAAPARAGGAIDIPRSMSREDFKALYEAYPQRVTESIASRVGERDRPDLPFRKLADTTPAGAYQLAARELADTMRGDLMGSAGNRAAPGEVAALKAQLAVIADKSSKLDALAAHVTPAVKEANPSRIQLPNMAGSWSRETMQKWEAPWAAAKRMAQDGKVTPADIAKIKKIGSGDQNLAPKKLADLVKEIKQRAAGPTKEEAAARQAIDEGKADLQAQRSAIEQKLETNRAASKAEQDIAAINSGKVPDAYHGQVLARAAQIQSQAAMLRAASETAASVIERATPEARQAAFRTALAQTVNGRMPDVDALVRGNFTLEQIKSTAARQAGADAMVLGDAAASKRATEQVNTAPKDTALPEAEADLKRVTESLTELKKNLEQSGMTPERTKEIMDQLKPFDDELAKADNYRAAAKAAAICGLRG